MSTEFGAPEEDLYRDFSGVSHAESWTFERPFQLSTLFP